MVPSAKRPRTEPAPRVVVPPPKQIKRKAKLLESLPVEETLPSSRPALRPPRPLFSFVGVPYGRVDITDSAKAQLHREILAEQMLSQFLTGLRDPVCRFVLSRDPKTFDKAIDVVAREELNKNLSRNHTVTVPHVEENADAHELRSRLDHLEKLLEGSLRKQVIPSERMGRETQRDPLILVDAMTATALAISSGNATGIDDGYRGTRVVIAVCQKTVAVRKRCQN
ncbi:hypothetical protein MTO96_022846 [Rhipicephalus appendiculatus]